MEKNNDFGEKKILILGGASQHLKLVECAKKMGLYTVVTDYIENSPAKLIADKSYMYSITDIDEIVQMCKQDDIKAVVSAYLDPAQIPYWKICNRLKLPCYGNEEQFIKLTNKRAFRKCCIENGLPAIKEYTLADVEAGTVEYPVLVKPVDSRGSRGQSICFTKAELVNAVEIAKENASNNDFLIEEFIQDASEFQVTYYFIDGKPYLLRTADSYVGTKEANMQKVVECSISPSRFTNDYLNTTDEKVIKMLKKMGIDNGPVFMQGFVKEKKFFFFDPGFRFPGVDYERVYKRVFGVDIAQLLVQYALDGKSNLNQIPSDGVWLKGKRAAILFPTLSKGKIAKLVNWEKIKQDKCVVSAYGRYEVGDEVKWSFDINQRLGEIDILCDTTEQLKTKIDEIQKKIVAYDIENKNMIYEYFEPQRIL